MFDLTPSDEEKAILNNIQNDEHLNKIFALVSFMLAMNSRKVMIINCCLCERLCIKYIPPQICGLKS